MVENRAAHAVLCCVYRTNIVTMHKRLSWLTVKHGFVYSFLVLNWDAFVTSTPMILFENEWQIILPNTPHEERFYNSQQEPVQSVEQFSIGLLWYRIHCQCSRTSVYVWIVCHQCLAWCGTPFVLWGAVWLFACVVRFVFDAVWLWVISYSQSVEICDPRKNSCCAATANRDLNKPS